jgi:glycosyltransferase involved in cell wall biosynthesis
VDAEEEMSQPKVTVVIPAYNQAEFLGEAIQSVLDQTFADFEVIVVNDASPDHTDEVVKQFDDPRLRYIHHKENRGLPATRNSGMRAAQGELIALLDADDLFHPEKLQAHVNYLRKHPEIGASYNNRFHLHHSMNTIRDLYRAPRVVGLRDFVLGFPFAPSDMVVRKEWAYKVNLFNQKHRNGAEDIDFPCRLALEGCRFGRVDQALNYRRFHTGRVWKNIRLRIEDAQLALEHIFNDPRCPPEVASLWAVALKNHYEILTYPAFVQGETELGQELLRKAICLVPDIIRGYPCSYVKMLATMSAADENLEHEVLLRSIFRQIKEFGQLSKQLDWAIARGYMIKGIRAVMWGREKEGRAYFALAAKKRASLDKNYLENIAYQFLNYASEFDYARSDGLLETLAPHLEQIGNRSCARYLRGYYFVNQAFERYHAHDFSNTRKALRQALLNQPGYLANRGVLSLLFRSLTNKPTMETVMVQSQPNG